MRMTTMTEELSLLLGGLSEVGLLFFAFLGFALGIWKTVGAALTRTTDKLGTRIDGLQRDVEDIREEHVKREDFAAAIKHLEHNLDRLQDALAEHGKALAAHGRETNSRLDNILLAMTRTQIKEKGAD